MTKLLKKKQNLAKSHLVSFPVYVVLGTMLMSILILGYFLYQVTAENTRLKQKYQKNTEDYIDSGVENETQ
jgi:hypothetical protein